MSTKTILLVFAKHPLLGRVKSRLGRSIGMESSLWVYRKLLERTSEISLRSKLKTVLFKNIVSPELKATFKHVNECQIQEGENLGEKMEVAFRWAFNQKHENVILIGSDLWTLNEETLIEAKKALEINDFVIGPCYDGGYYLIGMKKMNSKIFKNIQWSKDQVLKHTLSKVSGNSIYYLEIKNDIDNEESLKAHASLYDLYQKKISNNFKA